MLSEFKDYPIDGPTNIRGAPGMTLILIKDGAPVGYARTTMTKDEAVGGYREGADTLLLAWTGNYHTDIFRLTAADLARAYR